MAKKDWIQHSVPASHQGEFAAKAKAAGMSTAAYAQAKQHAPGKLGQQAREAMTLMHLNPNRAAMHHESPAEHAKAMQRHLNRSRGQ